MKRIEHIGIAVNDLDESVKIYTALLGKEAYKYEEVKSESVKTAFFQVGESKIELLQATDPSSAIAKYLKKNKNGFHHVAFEVEDIEEEISRLVSEGFQMIHKEPKDGADNKRIAFLHPKSSDGLLVEICQEKIS
jgi:methylmalonyl-CoA/ethylmalonyl-CoA epimerase